MNTEQIKSIINTAVQQYQVQKQTIGSFSVPLNTDQSSVNQLAKTEFPDWYFEFQDTEWDGSTATSDFWAFFNPEDNH
jgi:hypothetical protein